MEILFGRARSRSVSSEAPPLPYPYNEYKSPNTQYPTSSKGRIRSESPYAVSVSSDEFQPRGRGGRGHSGSPYTASINSDEFLQPRSSSRGRRCLGTTSSEALPLSYEQSASVRRTQSEPPPSYMPGGRNRLQSEPQLRSRSLSLSPRRLIGQVVDVVIEKRDAKRLVIPVADTSYKAQGVIVGEPQKLKNSKRIRGMREGMNALNSVPANRKITLSDEQLKHVPLPPSFNDNSFSYSGGKLGPQVTYRRGSGSDAPFFDIVSLDNFKSSYPDAYKDHQARQRRIVKIALKKWSPFHFLPSLLTTR